MGGARPRAGGGVRLRGLFYCALRPPTQPTYRRAFEAGVLRYLKPHAGAFLRYAPASQCSTPATGRARPLPLFHGGAGRALPLRSTLRGVRVLRYECPRSTGRAVAAAYGRSDYLCGVGGFSPPSAARCGCGQRSPAPGAMRHSRKHGCLFSTSSHICPLGRGALPAGARPHPAPDCPPRPCLCGVPARSSCAPSALRLRGC